MTCFWNNLHQPQVFSRSKRLGSQIIVWNKCLGARKPKDLNRITKIG